MRALLLFVLSTLASVAFAGEKLAGSNVDVRTTIAFKVSDAAAQRLLPEGWEVSSPTVGPSKGFNVAVVLIDSVSATDAEGKPTAPFRGGVLVIPARKKGTEAAFSMVVYGIVVPEVAPGAYGVYVPGQSAIERRVRSGADGKAMTDESWAFKTADGNAIDAQIQYAPGATAKAKLEAKVYSGAKPDFFRIYRFEQVTDVARSAATGVDRIVKVSFKAVGPKLAQLFDGSEQLISITSIPSYSRIVFLPTD